MSIAGDGNMNFHEEAGTQIGPVKLLLKRQQMFVADRTTEVLESSSLDQLRHIKGVEDPANIGIRRMYIENLKNSVWLNGPAWLQRSEDNWPKPWCQENEIEPEHATSSVAPETKPDKLFDWKGCSIFNRIRNFIATAWGSRRRKTNPSTQTKSIKQSKYIFDLFKTKASRMFQSR